MPATTQFEDLYYYKSMKMSIGVSFQNKKRL